MRRYTLAGWLNATVSVAILAMLAGCFGEGSGQERIPGTPPPPIAGPGDNPDFELVFADEFNEGTAPDPTKWNYELGYGDNDSGWGNNEWQLYTDSPDNVRVEGGNLVIEARCDMPPCGVRDGTVTSARITTQDKFEFRYGKIQARIKPPVGAGAWSAFWALGANFPEIGWPRSGEIDFMEIFNTSGSNEFTTNFAMHWCDDNLVPANVSCFQSGGRVFVSGSDRLDVSLGDDFHIFEAIWEPGRIIAKIDDRPFFFERDIDTTTMEEFVREFFLILNVAMGGTLGSGGQPPNGSETFPQTMLVDYIRVYQLPVEDGFSLDFEDDPTSYSFAEFEGGPVTVLANPVPGGINTSAQVARMQKFMAESGATFGGSVLTLPTPVTIDAGSMFTMKVWSPRTVNALLKLEGPGGLQDEVDLPHSGGSAWEELTYDFSDFSGTVEKLVFIFDNGTNGMAGTDPDNWTFYFDDITLIPPGMGGIDDTAPILTSVSIASSNIDPTVAGAGDIVTVSVVADEPIMMPTVMIGGELADMVAGSGASWQAGLELGAGTDGPITFTVDYTDLAGNSGNTVSASTDGSSVVFDSSALGVTILGAPESFSTLDSFPVTIEFTEFVVGFAAGDIQVGNGSASGLTITGDTTYTTNITPDGAGDVTIDIPAGVVMDLAGNSNEAAPTVTVLADLGVTTAELIAVAFESNNANPAYAKTGDVITISMTANGPINSPTVTFAGQPADSVTGADDTWQATRTMLDTDSEGEVGFTIDFEDTGGNPGPQTTMTTDGSSVTFDRTPPGLSIDGVPATISTLDAIPVTFQFDEDVTGFEIIDIIVVNGTKDGFTAVDLSTYTANVTPNGLGNLTVAVAAGRATDLAGNANTSAVASATLTSR